MQQVSVIHIFPDECIFKNTILQRADNLNHRVYKTHFLNNKFWKDAIEFVKLCKFIFKNRKNKFIIHQVNHFRLFLIKIIIPGFSYGLYYWGDDFYGVFIDMESFNKHCIRKSKTLDQNFYSTEFFEANSLLKRSIRRFKYVFKLRIGLHVIDKSIGVFSLSPKMWRVVKYFYFKVKKKNIKTIQTPTVGYSSLEKNKNSYNLNTNNNKLTILISHSAANTVFHLQSIEILKKYQKKWNNDLSVVSFLSYSGDEEYRENLASSIKNNCSFANLKIINQFLSKEDLVEELQNIDIALFSSLRDEGNGMLSEFTSLGGLISLNKFSFGYDFFKRKTASKLFTHEEFLELSPATIKKSRSIDSDWKDNLSSYKEISSLLLK